MYNPVQVVYYTNLYIYILGKSNLLIITLCPYHWFERWEDGKVKHRGDDYDGLKNAIGRQMLNQCLQMFPQLEDKVNRGCTCLKDMKLFTLT